MCNILNNDTAGNRPGTHGGKDLVEIIRQGNIRPFVHDAVDRHRESPVMFSVCHIVQCLEQVAVDHPHKIVQGRIRIRDTAEQRHLFLPDAPQIQFISTGQISNIRQFECRKADAHGNKDTLRRLSSNKMSIVFSSKNTRFCV